MKNFIVYDTGTSQVLRTGVAPENMLDIQAGPNESVIEGEIDEVTQKIVAGVVVPRDIEEINDYLYSQRLYTFPSINTELDDVELNQSIDHYYLGRVDVDQWRKENYASLRARFYPDQTELLDAQVKLSSADPSIKAEGQAQLDKYYQDALAVKERFPKP